MPPLDRVVAADCLEVLRRLSAGVADLAYLDPPFNTGRTHTAGRAAFDDRWPTVEAYLAFLRLRVEAVRRALKPQGSILLHCDWRTSHHARLLLDEIFGGTNFVNHLIWVYGLGGSSRRRFARKHDDILFYAKGDAHCFEPPLVPATSNRMKGKLKKASDVIQIPAVNNMAAERTGYPTQKPLPLMDLLVRACCPPGGVVLDPFCGSGTTLIAAKLSGRRYLGIDCNPRAVEIARDRIRRARRPA